MYLPSLPTIEIELAGEPGVSQLTLSAFFVGLAVGQLIYGPASDVLGRRKVLIWGIILYCLGGLAFVFVAPLPLPLPLAFVFVAFVAFVFVVFVFVCFGVLNDITIIMFNFQ